MPGNDFIDMIDWNEVERDMQKRMAARFLILDNPGMTWAEAYERIRKEKEEKEALKGAFSVMNNNIGSLSIEESKEIDKNENIGERQRAEGLGNRNQVHGKRQWWRRLWSKIAG